MKKIWIACMLLILPLGSAVAKDAYLSMVYTNALASELPFNIFSKNSWAPDSRARFVKLHLYFDEPIWVSGIVIDSCGARLDPHLSVFFNFDQWILSLSPELGGRIPRALYPKQQGGKLVLGGYGAPVEVRSLTFNFERNTNFKICNISLLDETEEQYQIKVPRVVKGKVSSDSVLQPVTAYSPMNLFDSRFEYAWASNKKAEKVNLQFSFDVPQKITKIRIWNGYQRSVNHCYSNSRARKIKVTGDNGYSEIIAVADVLSSQVVKLPKPFEGKKLNFEIVKSYKGKIYKDLVISELRFYNGKEWFVLDSSANLKNSIAENRKIFKKAEIDRVLNDSYVADKELKVEPYWVSAKMRLRADGSFYLSGAYGEAGLEQYFSLGNYEVKEYSPGKGLKLRLFGLYYETEVYGDCNGCGRDCNTKNADSKYKIFQEFFWLKNDKDNKVSVVNRNGGKRIKFDKLQFVREK